MFSLRPTSQLVYARTKRRDGYAKLEVSPHMAHDTPGTLDEAKRLWKPLSAITR